MSVVKQSAPQEAKESRRKQRANGHALLKANKTDRQIVIGAVHRLAPGDIATVAKAVRSEPHPRDPDSTQRLTSLLGPQPSRQRRIANEVIATLRAFEKRQELLAASLSAREVAEALGVSRETVYSRAERGELLAAVNGGHLRFPVWQFDPASVDGMLPGLRTILKELGTRTPLAKMTWLIAPRASLGGTPVDLLREGRLEQVIPAARRFALGE